MKTMEKEVFDNVNITPPYRDVGDYIHTMSLSTISEEVFDYQNMPNERRPSNTGSEVRSHLRSEVTKQPTPITASITEPIPSHGYANSEREDETSGYPSEVVYSNVQTDIQRTPKELKPKLSNTPSSNSYTHSPMSSPKYSKGAGGSLTDEESYFFLCEASSGDLYTKCLPYPSTESSFDYVPHQSVIK